MLIKLFPELSESQINEIGKNITITTKKYGDFTIYTIKVKTKRGMGDDETYCKYPLLLANIPRAFSVVVDADDNIVYVLRGVTKFGGAAPDDEDADGDADVGSDTSSIFPWEEVMDAAKNGNLKIDRTVKSNGKFGIVGAFDRDDEHYFVAGSKNSHRVCAATKEALAAFIESLDSGNDAIIRKVFADILRNFDILTSEPIMSKMLKGMVLCGELEDGQHFVTPSAENLNTIAFFGIFSGGEAHQTLETLNFLKESGLRTVSFEQVFNLGDDPNEIKNVIKKARSSDGEGVVLYFTFEGQTYLLKAKSTLYKFKRTAREMLKGGWINFLKMRERFSKDDKVKYHGLTDEATARIVHALMQFAIWGMKKQLPCGILNCMPINSVKGILDANGFCTYWDMFLTDRPEMKEMISLTPEDFGPFDKAKFLANPLVALPKRPSTSKRTIVVFTQGLQGSGKSTITASMIENLRGMVLTVEQVEQDQFYGCTQSAQSWLQYLLISDTPPDIIFVSRCNLNGDHYRSYLNIARTNGGRVIFMGSSALGSYQDLALAFLGVLKRSDTSDSLMVGRHELPPEQVVEILCKGFRSLSRHPQMAPITCQKDDQEIEDKAKAAFLAGEEAFRKFCEDNREWIYATKLSVDEITSQLVQILTSDDILRYEVHRTLAETMYIALCLNPEDRKKLMELMTKLSNGTVPDGHITQEYLGTPKKNAGKRTTNVSNLQRPGTKCSVHVSALVSFKKTGQKAYRVSEILDSDGNPVDVASGKPHITAFVPDGCKAADSVKFVFSDDPEEVSVEEMDVWVSTVTTYF